MGEWCTEKLGNLASVKGGKRLPKGSVLQENLTNHPYIRTRDIYDGKIAINELLYVPNEVFPKIQKYTVEKGDVIVSIVGTIGLCSIIPEELHLASLTENCAKIVDIDKKRLDKCFLYYFLSSSCGQDEIKKRNVGSTQSKLPLYNIKSIPLSLPVLKEQKAIAEVLASLDDKIDLLHRQNKTLEALAETLFRHTFIDNAKDDWEEKSLLKVINLVGGGTPKTSVKEYWDGGTIPWLSGGDIASGHKSILVTSKKAITEEGLNNSSVKRLPKFATVISARGTVGKYALLSRSMSYSQSNYGILPNIENCYFFTYLLINHVVGELQSTAYGSVFDTITTATFRDVKVTLPNDDAIKDFENEVLSLFERKLNCVEQIQTLEKLRDTLLPKLMSGDTRVKHDKVA